MATIIKLPREIWARSLEELGPENRFCEESGGHNFVLHSLSGDTIRFVPEPPQPPGRLGIADFPGGVTLRALIQNHCDGDEGKMWDLYFFGGMDEQLAALFENMVGPQARTTAVILRAFLRRLRS
jgi:hypothetical protein